MPRHCQKGRLPSPFQINKLGKEPNKRKRNSFFFSNASRHLTVLSFYSPHYLFISIRRRNDMGKTMLYLHSSPRSTIWTSHRDKTCGREKKKDAVCLIVLAHVTNPPNNPRQNVNQNQTNSLCYDDKRVFLRNTPEKKTTMLFKSDLWLSVIIKTNIFIIPSAIGN